MLWQFDNVQYQYNELVGGGDRLIFDTGAVTGSFIYDADTDQFSSIYIEGLLTQDEGHGESPYESFKGIADDGIGDAVSGILQFESSAINWAASCCGSTVYDPVYLNLYLAAGLSNAGGVIGIVPGSMDEDFLYSGSGEIACHHDEGCNFVTNSTRILSGQLVGTVVPVPAALWLFLSAIGLLGLRRTRVVG